VPRKLKAGVGAVLIALVVAAVVWITVWGSQGDRTVGSADAGAPAPTAAATAPADAATGPDADAAIARLFQSRLSDVQVAGEGVVARLLPDDLEGDAHQRFILRLGNGMTVLVAHNIDDFPRLDGLAVGDRVAFHGEYVWNEQGGTIHWTHRDRLDAHPDGWLEWNGRRYW